jgi:hypothetical protein
MLMRLNTLNLIVIKKIRTLRSYIRRLDLAKADKSLWNKLGLDKLTRPLSI